MNPGDAETNESKNMQQQAKEAAAIIIQQIQQEMMGDLQKIDQEQDPDRKAELQKELRDKVTQRLNLQKLANEASELKDKDDKQDEFKERSKEIKKTLLEANEVIKKTGRLTGKEDVDKIVAGLAEKIVIGELSDRDVVDIEQTIGKELAEGVVLSKEGQQKSTIEKNLENLKELNQGAWNKVVKVLEENPESLGTTKKEIIEKFNPEPSQADLLNQIEQEQDRNQRRGEFENIGVFEKFTEKQMEFIKRLHNPEEFVKDIDKEIRGGEGPGAETKKQEIEKEKKKITDDLKKHYEKRNLPFPEENKLKEVTEKVWLEKVSGKVEAKLMDVINHLYLQLQQERPDKFFEDITREDFMRGITTTQLAITAAIRKLSVTLGEAERNSSHSLHELVTRNKLVRNAEEDYYTEQRKKLTPEGELVERHYPVLKPLPFGKDVSLSEFVEYMNVGIINHWTHAMEYFHNTRVMHNHPPGEKGFYSQLGGYAEHLKGTDIDELLLLPDGQVILEAYHLYDKLMEEELAQQDWKVRANQFTNKLEETSTQLEREVRERLRLLYPEKSNEQLVNAVNTAVGIARGMLLTEPEKNAYSDPVDPEGGGFYASYATNDAGSLTVFNPLHVNLRWQGEHLLPMVYFMDVKRSGATWDHKKMWENGKLFMESVKNNKRDKRLPKKMFIDQVVDIINVGGPAKRRGWRMLHSLENHYEYFKHQAKDRDGKIVIENIIDPLESFKAMEMIGYEAMFHFIDGKKAGVNILNAKEGTPEAQKRNQWFEYLYKRYFYEGKAEDCPPGEIANYMKKLKNLGEIEAENHVKKHGSFAAGSLEAQIEAETSRLFLDRFIVREIAARFPSKFLRMDRNRYHEDGISRWKSIQKEFENNPNHKWDIEKFDDVMKDLSFAEVLLRQEMSKIVRERVKLEPGIGLNKFEDVDYKLSSEKIKKLFYQLKDKEGNRLMSEQRIKNVIDLYEEINKRIIHGVNPETGKHYLDGTCLEDVKAYTYTFGIEDTDISLMSWRGTGPRMTARAIKDTGSFETEVIPWIIESPKILNQLAISGKHDFSPIIEYLRKAQKAIQMVHGSGPDQEFVYKMASMIIQYFKKDTAAKFLFGAFRLGQKNSIAAEYAGRSGGVWEWDSRDIDRFIVSLEANHLIPREPYDKFKGPEYEDRYITIFGKQVKLGKKMKVVFENNAAKLRSEFGGDWRGMTFDIVNSIMPLIGAFILWQYLKKANEEAEGKKKQ